MTPERCKMTQNEPTLSVNYGPPQNDEGISLRDYFAGQALAGYKWGDYDDINGVAREAYCVADAMLSQREAQND